MLTVSDEVWGTPMTKGLRYLGRVFMPRFYARRGVWPMFINKYVSLYIYSYRCCSPTTPRG